MTLRYGIIGSGMMGQEHMRNIALLPDCKVTAVSDPDAGMREMAQKLAGDGCAAFAHHRELLDSGLCDALVIAAPNHLHHSILKDVLKSEIPILVEKPLCTTVEHCREILALASGRKAPVWVAMEYRYMPPLTRLALKLNAGEAGTVRMMTIREHRYPFLKKVGDWNRFNENTGGTLVEKCCHYFDLMRLLIQSEPVRIYASAGMDVNFLDEAYDGRKPDIIDNAFVIVDFANGVRAMLDLCMFSEGVYWQEEICVTGDLARIDARIPGPARFSADGKERRSEVAVSVRATKQVTTEAVEVDETILAAGDHHGSTYYQHERFRRLVLDGGTPEVGLKEGMLAVAMGAAAEASARTGQAIEFDQWLKGSGNG
ncbi:MAG: Gfo/Idh/MocA family oxidoreductase [Nitratireductor sp.]